MDKILFISYYFPPQKQIGGRRIANFVDASQKVGNNEVFVITTYIRDSEHKSGLFSLPINPDTLNVIKSKYKDALNCKSYIKAAFYRLLYGFHNKIGKKWDSKKFQKEAGRLIRKNDINIIITSGPPFFLHIVGLNLKKQFSLVWVADFRDPWVFPKELNGAVTKIASLKNSFFFNQTLLYADYITAVTKSQIDLLSTQHNKLMLKIRKKTNKSSQKKESSKFFHIQNGVDLGVFSRVKQKKSKSTGVLKFGYLGDIHYVHRDPKCLILAIKKFNKKSTRKIELHIWTDLNDLTIDNISVDDFVLKHKVDEFVYFHPYVSSEKSLEIQKNMDVLVNFALNQRLQIPAKTYENLLSGTSILGFCERDSETYKLLEKFERVFLVEDNQEKKILSALNSISKLPHDNKARGGLNLLAYQHSMMDFIESINLKNKYPTNHGV